MVHELILSDALFFSLRVDARPLVLGRLIVGKWPDSVIA